MRAWHGEGLQGCRRRYAKSWGAMQTTEDASEGAKIIEKYKHWITTRRRCGLPRTMRSTCIPFRRIATSEVTSK